MKDPASYNLNIGTGTSLKIPTIQLPSKQLPASSEDKLKPENIHNQVYSPFLKEKIKAPRPGNMDTILDSTHNIPDIDTDEYISDHNVLVSKQLRRRTLLKENHSHVPNGLIHRH
jgi:hypothetical protein